MVIKCVWTDAADDTTYTSPNTSGVPADPNQTPQVTSAVTERHPNDSQGLASAIQTSANAETTNSTS